MKYQKLNVVKKEEDEIRISEEQLCHTEEIASIEKKVRVPFLDAMAWELNPDYDWVVTKGLFNEILLVPIKQDTKEEHHFYGRKQK